MRVIISIILMVIAALVGFFFGAGMNEAMGGAILLSMITGFACIINAIEKNKKDWQLPVLRIEKIEICKGGLCMRIWKAIFSVLTIIFGSLGLINIVSTDITLPIMFVFMGLTMLTNAKECYDKGAKKDAMIFAGIAIFVYVVTAYNLISRFM